MTTLRDIQVPRVERAMAEVDDLRHIPVGTMTHQGRQGVGVFLDHANIEHFIDFCRSQVDGS